MTIVWSPQAIDDLVSLRAFIAEENPAAAQRIALLILETVVQLLGDHPNIGRAGRVPGTRELVVSGTPYVVPYRVRHRRVEVLRIYHSARRWPDQF